MLDENLPTYRSQPSPDDPLRTLLFFSHNGSEPAPEYLLRRPSPPDARNQYALGLLDARHPSVVYAEVLLRPEWSQPTLSAAEVRAVSPVPLVPDAFTLSLYNPDQPILVRHRPASWSKSDAWVFEVPERSFRLPSASRIDRDAPQSPDAAAGAADLTPRLLFRWKRDGRLSKDMTCYMCGRTVGGNKSKEPDITVAMYRAAKAGGTATIYEPNMARVDVEDRKGLEVALILGAEVIRDLYLLPRPNPFNAASVGAGPTHVAAARKSSNPPPAQMALVSGALGDAPPPPPLSSSSSPPPPPPQRPSASPGPSSPPRRDARRQAEIDAETKRLQAMVADQGRRARERERRDLEEQKRIREMLDREDRERRKRDDEVERETERLRREYGVAPPPPLLPPRPAPPAGAWFGARPARPSSVGPPPRQDQGRRKPSGGGLGALLLQGHRAADEDRRAKMRKKRSVHF